MRKARRATWAGLGLLLLVGGAPLRAEAPPSALPPIQSGPPESVPPPVESPTPLAVPHDEERGYGPGIFLIEEYLLYRARRNALDFAVRGPSLTDTAAGTIESLSWETRSAFRTGIGYQLPNEPWRVSVAYTNLYTSGDRTVTAPPGSELFATLTRSGSVDNVTGATGFTSLYYNVIDLDASRQVCVSPSLEVQVFGGGRFAWIDQKLTATYTGGSASPSADVVSSPVFFRGAGLSVGSQGFWKVWDHLGLYGRGRLSLLSGQFRNFLSETIDGTVTVVNVRETNYQIVPVTELEAGLAWQGDHLSFRVGYQLVNWYNMVNSPDFPSAPNVGKLGRRSSDLTLEGLAIEVGLLF